ncbi:MAG TPA: nuclease-related domain-containing protein [Rhodoglobus sp.]|nr:nuclease-related domain-containing protein [Rhodoglobus sp.]
MSDLLQRGDTGVSPTSSMRTPAARAMTECLRLRATAPRRSTVAWLLGLSPLPRDARPWYRSALGELHVAAQLRALGDAWTVLTADDADAGRLIIGPAGAFIVDTRDHAGQRVQVSETQLLVNGRRTNHLANARHQSAAASRILSSGVGGPIDVTPVIALVDPGSLSFMGPRPSDVLVTASSQLVRLLTRRKRSADAPADALVATAQRAGWHPETEVADERTLERFAVLRHAVDTARWRRFGWVAGAALLIVAACWLGLGV